MQDQTYRMIALCTLLEIWPLRMLNQECFLYLDMTFKYGYNDNIDGYKSSVQAICATLLFTNCFIPLLLPITWNYLYSLYSYTSEIFTVSYKMLIVHVVVLYLGKKNPIENHITFYFTFFE